jgi:hypothetical protein
LRDPTLTADGALGPFNYTGSDINLIDSRVDGLRMSQVPEKDLHVFKAGMRKRLSQTWGPVLSLPAIPGSDLILESVLDRMISKM